MLQHICVPVLGRWRQEDCHKFEARLGYRVSSRQLESKTFRTTVALEWALEVSKHEKRQKARILISKAQPIQ